MEPVLLVPQVVSLMLLDLRFEKVFLRPLNMLFFIEGLTNVCVGVREAMRRGSQVLMHCRL